MTAKKDLDLKVINLWGAPCVGKSTTAAGLFNAMKMIGVRVELVTEYAKDLTYAKDYGSLENQLILLANQDQRLRRLEGQVDWAITDSPLPLGLAYITPEYEDWLPGAILGAYDRYDNYDFLLRRSKPYQTYGRNQTEAEALALDVTIKDLFERATDSEDGRWEVAGDNFAPYTILGKLEVAGAEEFLHG